MLETLAALVILGLVSVAFVQGLVVTSQGTGLHERRVIALNLAQSQVEYIKSQEFQAEGDYDVIEGLPDGYSLNIEAYLNEEETRQEVEVKVDHEGEFVFGMTVLKRVA